MSVPRLELLGILIGIQLLNFVATEMHLQTSRKYLWSDSKCALSRSTGTTLEKLRRFIKNRVSEIKEAKDVQFKFIHGIDNPADVATRGAAPTELNANSHWWKGPLWLQMEQNCWPNIPLPTDDDEANQELKANATKQ